MSKKLKNYAPAVVLAILTISLYTLTMSRSIYTEDSAEFVAASYTLSIPHPSGYPTYLLTAKLASFLPFFASVAERVNFMSVVWTVLAIVLLYFSLQKLFKNKTISFALSFLFAIAPMVWLQATYAEVYALNTCFFALLLFLYLKYNEHSSLKNLYIFIFAYGLSLTNHFLILAIAPLILLWLFYKYSPLENIKQHLKFFGIFLLGLTPYLYIPIRARMSPDFSWFGGNAVNLLTYNVATGHRFTADTLVYLSDVWNQFFVSFGIFGGLALAAGLGIMMYYKNQIRVLAFTGLILLSLGLVVVLTNGREYDAFSGWFYQTLYVPFLLVSLIPIGFALLRLSQSRFKIIFFYTALLALMAWPLADIGGRFLENDRSGYTMLDGYSMALIESIPKNGAIFAHHDHVVNDPIIFGLAYQKFVKNLRPDVSIYSVSPVFMPPSDFPVKEAKGMQGKYMDIVKPYVIESREKHNIPYTTFPWTSNDALASVSRGYFYEIGNAKAEKLVINYTPDNLDLPATNDSLYHQSLIAKYYYDLAAWAYGRGQKKSGQWFLVQGISYDLEEYSAQYSEALSFREQY